MKTAFLFIVAMLACAVAVATTVTKPTHITVANVVPSANAAYTNWANAGLSVIGGIPVRTTQCGSTVSPIGGGADDYAHIQAALNGCVAGEYVQLAAGAFSVVIADLPIVISSGVTLRGADTCPGNFSSYPAGACGTSITVSNGILPYVNDKCGTDTSHEVACPDGGAPLLLIAPAGVAPYYNYSWEQCGNMLGPIGTGCGGTPLAADAAQGATTIQVTSTAGFSVGSWVLINEASGAQWEPDPITSATGFVNVWAAPDWNSSSSGPATGRIVWPKAQSNSGNWDFASGTYPYQVDSEGCWYSYCDRPTQELHLVASIGAGPCPGTSCTLTFDDPLTIAYRAGGGTTFSGTVTSGSKTLTIVSGNVNIGQIVAGTGIPIGDYVASGSGSTYAMSIAATASETAESMTIGSHEAEVYAAFYPNQGGTGSSIPLLSEAGVENLSLLRAPNGGLTMEFCVYCWVRNVEVGEWTGGGVDIWGSARSEFVHGWIHHCWYCASNGGEYPLAIDGGSTEVLVTDSIINFAGKGMVSRAPGGGDVVSYNYIDDTFYDSFSGIGDYWVETDGPSHFSGPHHVLLEGNWAPNLDVDTTHGNSMYITYFRNVGSGLRTPFTDPSNGKSVDDFTGVGWTCSNGSCNANAPAPLRAAGPEQYNYWFAYVGNVLGTSGETTSGHGWVYYGNGQSPNIFMLGVDTASGGQDPNLDGASASFVWIDGNYDYFHSAVTWDPTDSIHALPNSLYLQGEPSFFEAGAICVYPWPWVAPNSSPQLPDNSCSGSGLPAQARWNAGTPFIQP